MDGKRLFARYDQADLTVKGVTGSLSSRATLTATVANVGTANAGGIVVRFMEGTQVLGTSAAIGLGAGASAQVSISWPGTNPRGTHTITAIVDPDNWVSESNEGNNKTMATITLP
jgi:subtilase family serine protease